MWCEAQSAAVRIRVTFIIKCRSCSASCSVSFVCAQVSFNPMTIPTLEMNPFDCDMPTLEVWPDDAGANNYVSLKLDAIVCAIVAMFCPHHYCGMCPLGSTNRSFVTRRGRRSAVSFRSAWHR